MQAGGTPCAASLRAVVALGSQKHRGATVGYQLWGSKAGLVLWTQTGHSDHLGFGVPFV